ncbi:MAG: DUF1583 domain-containing protein [Planctomycetes bacterium]|nr:DUF1583 domain-containing protein [Planctomycetota bacterium]
MNVSVDSRRRLPRWSWVLVAALLGACLAAGVWLALRRAARREAEVAKSLPGRAVTKPMQGWSVAYSPDGKQIVAGVGRPNARGELQLWDAVSGKLIARSKEQRGVASVAFSPDGDLVAGCNWEDVVKIYRVDTLDVTVTIPLEKPAELAFSPDGKTLATAIKQHVSFPEPSVNVRLWDVASGNEALQCEGELILIRCVAFSPDGKLIAAAGDAVDHRDGLSPDAKPFAEGGQGTVMVSRVICWDAATGEKALVLEGQGGTVTTLAFSPDGATMATGGRGQIRLWDIASSEVKKTLEGHEGWVQSIAFSPDGTMLATGGTDRTAILWDVEVGEPLASFVADTESVRSLAFSPDGATLVTVGREGSPKLWDTTIPRETGALGPVAVLTEPVSDLGEAGRPGAAPMEARLTLDFREQFKLEHSKLLAGGNLGPYCKPELAGLRVTIPENADKNLNTYDTKIVVKGDFEITAGFTFLDVPRPEQGFGAGPRISIEDSLGERAGVHRMHREREGHVFIAYHSPAPEDGVREHLVQYADTEGDSGWLRLSREGTTLSYMAAERGSDHFTRFYESEFPNDVAKLQLVVQTGGSPTRVDVVWTHLDVRAEELAGGVEQ